MMLVRIIGKQKALADEIIGCRGDRGDIASVTAITLVQG